MTARGGEATEHGTAALNRRQDAEELAAAMKPLIDDGEDRDIGEPGDQQGNRHRTRHSGQHRNAANVTNTCRDLGPERFAFVCRGVLAQPHRDRRHCCGDEDRRCGHRERRSTEDSVDTSPEQWTQQPQPLVDRAEQSIPTGELVVGQQIAHQAGSGGAGDVRQEAIHERHPIDQPDIVATVYEYQRQHDRSLDQVGSDHDLAARVAVSKLAGKGCEQHRQPQEEEHQTRCGVAVCEVLYPDGQGEVQDAVAEV